MEKIEQDGTVEHDSEGALLAKVHLKRRRLSRDLDFQVEGTTGAKALGKELT